jgi:hypothetical protein
LKPVSKFLDKKEVKMTSPKRVVIEIFDDGKVTVDAQGWSGKACVEDLKWLEELLGSPKTRMFKDAFRKVEAIKIIN